MESNETMGSPNDWSKPAASSVKGVSANSKSYDIPFKALLRGALTVSATSRKAAVTQVRQLLKRASLIVHHTREDGGRLLPLPGVTVKKQSVTASKKK